MKMGALTGLLAATVTLASGAGAQGVVLVKAASLDQLAARIAATGSTGDTFASRPGVNVVESRRVHDGSVEVHDAWMDVTYVQAGRAVLLTGGRVTGPMSLMSPGEHRGGQITGGAPQLLAAG